MKIAVIMRQVPDPVEPLELADDGISLDPDQTAYVPNETDEHALEQALLLKEAVGGQVAVVALDTGQVDQMLYAAAAKGAEQIIKIPAGPVGPTGSRMAAAMWAEAIAPLEPDLVLIGCLATSELEGAGAPMLAHALGLPYLGGIRGVEPANAGVTACKEFPAAVKAEMHVKLPAVLGILAASEPIRYLPVSRIRAATKSTKVDEREVSAPSGLSLATVCRLHAPESGQHAQMIEGTTEQIARRIVEILDQKGLVK